MSKIKDTILELKNTSLSINEICEKFKYSPKTAAWYIKYGFKRMGFNIEIEQVNGIAKYRIKS